MTEEEHQNMWPVAQAMITHAAANAPSAGSAGAEDYYRREAERICRETGYGDNYPGEVSEIAASIKCRNENGSARKMLYG